jgi:site-specific DNA-methyltransferase (adenine-specific)
MMLQGDCLELMKDLPDNSVDMILCDLPYGVTDCKWDSVIPFEPLWAQYKRITKENAAIVLNASQPFTTSLIASNLKDFRYCWTWVKPYVTGFMNANKMPLRNTEDICVFYKRLPTYNPQGVIEVNNRVKGRSRKGDATIYTDAGIKPGIYTQKYKNHPNQVLEYNRDKNALHPTQKPVALLEYLIKTYTNPDDTVLDNCMGSGSTGVACLNTGRRFIGMELNQDYYNIATNRINAAMLKTA